MKKKILLLMLMGLFTIVLAGCDFGNTTAVTTTSGTTSSQTTATTGTTTTTTTIGTGTTTTTTIPTTTTTTTTTTASFNREDLVSFLEDQKDYTPEEGEIEGEIDMYMEVFGFETEAQLYQMLLNADSLMTGLMGVDTLTEFQTWYAGAKYLGFNQAMMTTTMMNAVGLALEQASMMNADDINAEIAGVEDQITAKYVEIQGYLDDAAAVRDTVVTYASQFSAPDDAQVVEFYDRLVIDKLAQDNYFDLYYTLYDFDENVMYEYGMLESDLTMYFTYTYVETGMDPQTFMADYTAGLAALDSDTYNAVFPVLESFMDYQEGYYMYTIPAMNNIASVIDNQDNYTSGVIYNYFYDYQDSDWLVSFAQYEIDDLMYEIDDLNGQLMMLAMAEQFDAYFNTTEGLATTTAMMAMIYDTVDYIATNVSQSSFDFVMGLFNGEMEFDPETMTSLEIVGLITQVSDLINLVHDSFSEGDIATLVMFSQDVASMYVMTLGLDPVDEAAMIALMNTEIEAYFTMVDDVFTELLSFIDSISVAKVDAIMDFADIMSSDLSTEYEVTIALATVIDVVLGDGSLDLTLLVNYAIDTMYDFDTMFEPNITERDALKLSVNTAMTDILAQAAVISLYDATNLTTEQITNVQAFMTSIQDLMGLITVSISEKTIE